MASRKIIYAGAPVPKSVRWNAVGDFISLAVWHIHREQERVFGTQDLAFYEKSGKPKMHHVVFGFAVDHSDGFELSTGKDTEPISLADAGGNGTAVAVYVPERESKSFLGLQPEDGFASGDVLTVKFTHEGDASRGGNRAKHRSYTLAPNTDDDMIARCEMATDAYDDAEAEKDAKSDADSDDDAWDDDPPAPASSNGSAALSIADGRALRQWCEDNGIEATTAMAAVRGRGLKLSSLTTQQASEIAAELAAVD